LIESVESKSGGLFDWIMRIVGFDQSLQRQGK